MTTNTPLPWDREFLEARQISKEVDEIVTALLAVASITSDSFLRTPLLGALRDARVVQARARQIFKDQSLRHAEQVELIADEGDALAREVGDTLDALGGGPAGLKHDFTGGTRVCRGCGLMDGDTKGFCSGALQLSGKEG